MKNQTQNQIQDITHKEVAEPAVVHEVEKSSLFSGQDETPERSQGSQATKKPLKKWAHHYD